MKFLLSVLLVALGSLPLGAVTPEQEKTFVEKYRKAIEANDTVAIAGFLFTDGAEEETIQFFTRMQKVDPLAKIVSIELVKPTPEQAEKFASPQNLPNGKTYRMPLKPVKLLVVKTKSGDPSAPFSTGSTIPVAEKDGKLGIIVPVPVKK